MFFCNSRKRDSTFEQKTQSLSQLLTLSPSNAGTFRRRDRPAGHCDGSRHDGGRTESHRSGKPYHIEHTTRGINVHLVAKDRRDTSEW